MRIGIIGGGNVGGTLGRAWAQRGHEVTFGSRDPNSRKIQELIASTGGAGKAATIPEAVANAEVVAVATPWPATQAAIESAGDLSGKILLDCTNPLAPDLSLEFGHTTSGGEQVSAWARSARVVKIFNTTGFENMADPGYGDQACTMFYAGDDSEAKSVAAQLAREIGFDPVDAGPPVERTIDGAPCRPLDLPGERSGAGNFDRIQATQQVNEAGLRRRAFALRRGPR